MVNATISITGTSPYSQSGVIESPKGPKETSADHEERTWGERMHKTDDGFMFIPPTAFKNCLSEAAKYLGKQVPGKGKATYTKHFEAGVMCIEPVVLAVKAEDVKPERLFVPADGRRGGPKRVWKLFPTIPAGWQASVGFIIVDPLVTEEVFHEHVTEMGNFIGIGRFRPRNNGYYGRFIVNDLKWVQR